MAKEPTITLTIGERAELHRAWANVEQAQATGRLQAVRRADCGWPAADIARHLYTTRTTIIRPLDAFVTGGFDALAALPHTRHQPSASLYAYPWYGDRGSDRSAERALLRMATLADDGDHLAGVVCWTPPLWLELGIFPIEWGAPVTAHAGSSPVPASEFAVVIEGLWRHPLADRSAREAFRRDEFALPEDSHAVEGYLHALSGGAQKRFLAAAGVDWWSPPRWPTCAHAGCCVTWFDALAGWRRPVRDRVWRWLVEALRKRVLVQSVWPRPQGIVSPSQPWLTRPIHVPYPRLLPWEAGDGC
jgi:hypothetical protein